MAPSAEGETGDVEGDGPEKFIEPPLTGEIDLHTFRPNEIGSLLPEYFRECRLRGWLEVRVIHGKGTGTLREGVHRLLDRLPEVVGYRLGDETSGGWGATRVSLKRWEPETPEGGGESPDHSPVS